MRFASRLIPHAGSARGYVLVAMGLLALGLGGGCEDKHIGRSCITNTQPDSGVSGGAVTIISSPALQCPSRICIQPGDMNGTATKNNEGAFCTASCSTDDDCSDTDPGAECTGGFYCMWPTTSGPFCCQKLCVCKDFVIRPMGGFQPPNTCESPGNGGPNPPTCQNVSP